MRQLLTGLLLLAPATFCHAGRAVMEQLAASANTIFVSTTNSRVGVSTITPAATLDVAGNAQFGSTGKSTFSATGALSLASNAALTLSGASGNIVTASSVNAGSFWGNGAGLSGIPSSGSIVGVYLPLSGGTMTGNLTTTSSVTILGNRFSVGTATFSISGSSVGIRNSSPVFALDVSSGDINVQNSYRRNGVSGVTLGACSAGQAVGGATILGGIVTGAASCITSGGGDVVTTATQTLSGVNTFVSTSNFQGLVTGVHNSSFVAVALANVTATSLGVAQATATFTASTGTYIALLNMRVLGSGAVTPFCGIEVNGAPVAPYTAARWNAWKDVSSASSYGILSGPSMPFRLNGGTVNVQLTCAVDTGTGTICHPASDSLACVFGVMRVGD